MKTQKSWRSLDHNTTSALLKAPLPNARFLPRRVVDPKQLLDQHGPTQLQVGHHQDQRRQASPRRQAWVARPQTERSPAWPLA